MPNRRSEVRSVRSLDRFNLKTKITRIVFSADVLDHRTLRDAAIVLHPAPWRREGPRILNGGDGFQRLSVFDDTVAFDNVELVCVRRPELVDKGPGIKPDRID